MENQPGVEAAAPDMVHHVTSTSPPVTTNDTYYTRLQHLWDRRDWSPSLPDNFASGGFSTRAANLWRATTGSPNVIVAVLDTGVTNHKDFNANRLTGGGYDFVSDVVEFDPPDGAPIQIPWSRDGDGWDSNPADPGDYELANDCGYTHPAFPSSWHGTHVAGIIAAQANNKTGVVGVAPGVKFAPVRVVGPCGALDSDIIAGITWSTGGHVTGEGAPADLPQASWAKVVNLSVGYDDYDGFIAHNTTYVDQVCAVYAPVVAAARARGSVIINAAGNSGIDARYSTPSACAGVFSVAATSARGYAANYSNYGGQGNGTIDISAPGGDTVVEGPGDGILSTLNTGTKGPVSATYGRMEGTSMAAPMVSGTAALLYSAGMTTAVQVEKGLIGAFQPFAVYDSDYHELNCSPGDESFYCGVGILNLARVQALLKGQRPTITGTPRVGKLLSTGTGYGQWNNSGAGFTFQWMADGVNIPGATSRTYTVTSADLGKRLKVKVTPKLPEYVPLFHTSPTTAVVTN